MTDTNPAHADPASSSAAVASDVVESPAPATAPPAAPAPADAPASPDAPKRGRPALTPEERERRKAERNAKAREQRAALKASGGTARANPDLDRIGSVTPKAPIDQPRALAAPAIAINYQHMGEQAATLWFGVGVIAFGKDWEPDTEQGEHTHVATAFRDYFKAKQVTQLDPSIALVATLGAYTLARVQKPTFRQRINGAFTWLKANLRIGKRS